MRICVIDDLEDRFRVRSQQRSTGAKSIGIRCVEDDILLRHGGRKLPRVPLSDIRMYDVALLPLLSVQDVESFVRRTDPMLNPEYRRNRCKIIAGGFGCLNIATIADRIDVAVFGRCDAGQINRVLKGERESNVWYRDDDPELSQSYTVGQFQPPQKRIETGTVGCRMRCRYCQYTHVRAEGHAAYRSASNITRTDLWAVDFAKRGVHYSAIDGLSESTRRRVNKPISDAFLAEKIQSAMCDATRGVTTGINLFNIVGYPWETPRSVTTDMQSLCDLLAALDRKTGKWRIRITLHHTPFSPEPLTPMECCHVDWQADYRDILQRKHTGVDVTVKSDPYLSGRRSRAARMAINRATPASAKRVREFLCDRMADTDIMDVIEATQMPATWLVRPVEYTHMEVPLCSAH